MDYDIVIDLRSQATNHPLDVNLDILNEAADEIESLRQQLAEQSQSVNDALERAAIRGRLAQLEGKLVDVEIRALKDKG